jgi:LysM repeat protein
LRRAPLIAAVLFATVFAAPAGAAVPHVVQAGETLWSIAAANNLTTRTVAVFNALPEDAAVVLGQTIQVPTTAEGAQALINAGIAPGSSSTGTTVSAGSTTSSSGGVMVPAASASSGTGSVPSPWGELPLAPAAADAWNAMRDESLNTTGVDIYPGGPLSAYRSYDQQAYLYNLYLSGQGAPANPPGTSSHETGDAVDVATPAMRSVVDQLGWRYGWSKVHAPYEWWHVDYVGG